MPLPLVALPLAAAGAQAIGAGLGAAGAFSEANAMMPESYQRRLAQLQSLERAGELGLSDADRLRMEQDAARQAGGMLAADQARQLQQAQSLAGGGAITGAQLFQNEMMTQETQAQLAANAQREIIEANRRAAAEQRQQLMELEMQQESADAARRKIGFSLARDIVTAGATAGIGIAGAQQYAKGASQMANAVAGSQAARNAAMQQVQGQMAMSMAGAFAPMGVTAPGGQPVPVGPRTTALPPVPEGAVAPMPGYPGYRVYGGPF